MKYSEAIKIIPSGSTVSIGCRKGAGWFYFTKSEVLKIETEIIFQAMDSKMKKKLKQIRWNIPTLEKQMMSDKYLNAVTLNGYLRDWKSLESMKNRLPKMWKEYGEFNIIELLNCECIVRKKLNGSYGIILKRWEVSGNYWTKEEWEGDHGKI